MSIDASTPSPSQQNARRHSLTLFELRTDNEPVKFVNSLTLMHLRQTGWKAAGYFTQAKWLYGATPIELQERLGLRRGEFGHVAFALVFEQLPRMDGFDYCLTAAFPGGQHRPRAEDARMAADSKAEGPVLERSMTPVDRHYPRGDGVIQQWKLLKPLELSPYVRTITPSLPFARRDNTTTSNEPRLGKLRGVDWD